MLAKLAGLYGFETNSNSDELDIFAALGGN